MSDPTTIRYPEVASRENKESEYSLSDYKKQIWKKFMSMRGATNRARGQNDSIPALPFAQGEKSLLENRGVKTAPFVVLIGTQMPASWLEIACLSNEDEVQLLTKEDYRENIALALLRGIRSYANSLNTPVAKGR